MSVRCKECDVKSCAVAVLSDAELERLSGSIAEAHFYRNDSLFHEGTLNAHVFYLRKGLVKIHKKAGDQQERILNLSLGPTYVGLPTIFGDCKNQYSATALEPCSVCVIDIQTFKELIYTNGRFAYEIIADICKEELDFFQRFSDLTRKQAPGLIADILLYLCEKIYAGSCFEITLTRTEIAQLLGISRESVSRQLSQFKEDGIIDVQKNRITILNRSALEHIRAAG